MADTTRDSPVPEGNDPVCKLGVLQVRESVPGQTKVSQFQLPLVIDQQIGGLEVTMNDPIEVTMRQAIAELLHVQLDLRTVYTALVVALPAIGLCSWHAEGALRGEQCCEYVACDL